jgi:hypothetical protein
VEKFSSSVRSFHDVLWLRAQDKKISQRWSIPRGRRHALSLRHVPIPLRKGGLKNERVWGGCIAIVRGGKVKRDSISWE